jgi:hypothetical protein
MTVKSVVLPDHSMGIVLAANASTRSEVHGAALEGVLEMAGVSLSTSAAQATEHARLAGVYSLVGSVLAFPLFSVDCGLRLTVFFERGSLLARGRRWGPVAVVDMAGIPTFWFRGSPITMHLLPGRTPALDELLLGGAYAGVIMHKYKS